MIEALIVLVCLQDGGSACHNASLAYYKQQGIEAEFDKVVEYNRVKYNDLVLKYEPLFVLSNVMINQRVEFRATFP